MRCLTADDGLAVQNRAEFMNHFLSKIPVIFPNGIKVESISLEVHGRLSCAVHPFDL